MCLVFLRYKQKFCHSYNLYNLPFPNCLGIQFINLYIKHLTAKLSRQGGLTLATEAVIAAWSVCRRCCLTAVPEKNHLLISPYQAAVRHKGSAWPFSSKKQKQEFLLFITTTQSLHLSATDCLSAAGARRSQVPAPYVWDPLSCVIQTPTAEQPAWGKRPGLAAPVSDSRAIACHSILPPCQLKNVQHSLQRSQEPNLLPGQRERLVKDV